MIVEEVHPGRILKRELEARGLSAAALALKLHCAQRFIFTLLCVNMSVRNAKESWEDEWSCGCGDDCPHCGARHMMPVDSIDLTEIIEEYQGEFLVFISPLSAEDAADYELIAKCDSRNAAEKIINESGDGPVGFVD